MTLVPIESIRIGIFDISYYPIDHCLHQKIIWELRQKVMFSGGSWQSESLHLYSPFAEAK
jgi:hypothetical protein